MEQFAPSCAFVALHLMSRTAMFELGHPEIILLGSAQLLGLLIERAQRLEEKAMRADMEVKQMKLIRAEDAKANEKVVGIFASHEQTWISERKRLRLQIRCLAAELESLSERTEETISVLNKRVEEGDCAIRNRDEAFEEEAKHWKELEEKLELAQKVTEELREKANKEAQDHFNELREQKTSQSQLEAEMAQILGQAEAAKQELDEMFERKEEAVSMVEKLSDEMLKTQKDAEQKDKILSALLRKSKLDAAEKQMLLKEVKISKAKKKQAELEMEKWRNKWESRHKKGSRESYSMEAECSQERREELQFKSSGFSSKTLLLEYLGIEWQKERDISEPKGDNCIAAVKCLDQHSSQELSTEIVTNDIHHMQDWVRLDVEKYATILEKKHFIEIEAFTEQMRLKDEKLETFHWRLLSMEIESKRLQSIIEGLEEDLAQIREVNMKLEALLVDREGEIKSLKEQFGFFVHHCQKKNLKQFTASSASEPKSLLSEMSPRMRKTREINQEAKANSARNSDSLDNDLTAIVPTNAEPPTNNSEDSSIVRIDGRSFEEAESIESSYGDLEKRITLVTQSPKLEIEEEKEVKIDSCKEAESVKKLAPVGQSIIRKDSSWKMDIHALGVSYKIKRLKQQLLVVEKLAGMKQITVEADTSGSPEDNKQQLKGFMLVIHLLNKQVKRFQSLEEKTDDLCRRMDENSRGGSRRDSQNGKTKEQCRMLESFLEETFQLQRYMVATGQKLMDVQSKISSSFGGSNGLAESAGFNMGQFADVIKTLFTEIQRGLEVRIARIIGDLEGTLASDGIRHM